MDIPAVGGKICPGSLINRGNGLVSQIEADQDSAGISLFIVFGGIVCGVRIGVRILFHDPLTVRRVRVRDQIQKSATRFLLLGIYDPAGVVVVEKVAAGFGDKAVFVAAAEFLKSGFEKTI